MNRTVLDLWVGLFVMLGFCALLFLALKAGNVSTFAATRYYSVEVDFNNIGGLKAKAPVKSAGVLVGRVKGIELDPHTYDAKVTLDINEHYPFPTDTIASILTSGLLGEQYIGFAPGADDAMLKDGDRMMKGQSAMILEQMIGQLLFSKAAE